MTNTHTTIERRCTRCDAPTEFYPEAGGGFYCTNGHDEPRARTIAVEVTR